MQIRRYTDNDTQRWDQFVGDSKNGTFLFFRNYMDYHRDRFEDHSLIVENDKNQIVAIIPANEILSSQSHKRVLFSHQGLTYGGLVLSSKNKVFDVLKIFDIVIDYLRQNHFESWYYKQIPTIYHQIPAQEDEYALWKNNASLEACLISSTIKLNEIFGNTLLEGQRRRGMEHALLQGYQLIETSDIQQFWPIMEQNLMIKYAAKPVHSIHEMELLMSRFPKSIKCYLAVKDGEPQAGAIIYIANKMTVHLQYCHATEQGKKDRVLDFLYISLTEIFQQQSFQYFDLGTSNEDGGKYLNESLIANKQSFGGRGIAYKTYRIQID